MGMISTISTNVKAAFGGLSFGLSRRDAVRSDVPEMEGWNPPAGFGGTMSQGDIETLFGRARDLDENNGWINGGLDRRVEAVVGGQIKLRAQPAYEVLGRDNAWRMAWGATTQARFRVWSEDIDRRCDVRMKLTFGAMVKLAYLSYLRDGEAVAEIQDHWRGMSNPTSVLLFEPERICTPTHMQESKLLRNGIVFDENGAAIGAWVRSCHLSDPDPKAERYRWDYVPMRDAATGRAKLLHVFSPRRAEQNRGISKLAEAMVPAKMLDRVDRAEVQAALQSAIMSFFIKSPAHSDDLEQALAPTTAAGDAVFTPYQKTYLDMREKKPVRLAGAQVTQLLPDEDVVIPNAARPNANYPDFARFVLQKIAGVLGVSSPQLSQDWQGINYSSARAMLNEIWRSFVEDRHFFTQAFCTPIYAAWLYWEVANGDVKIPGGPSAFIKNKTAVCMAEWIGPGRGSVDPQKEANANNLDIAAGRKSTVEAILETGRDPIDVMDEEAWLMAERELRNLAPLNHNVKADTASADNADSGGTETDRDGDGIPNEDQKKKPRGGDQGGSQ